MAGLTFRVGFAQLWPRWHASMRQSLHHNPALLSILAAAFAEAGDFAAAVALQQQVIALVTKAERRSACDAELRLYQSGQSMRDENWR